MMATLTEFFCVCIFPSDAEPIIKCQLQILEFYLKYTMVCLLGVSLEHLGGSLKMNHSDAHWVAPGMGDSGLF